MFGGPSFKLFRLLGFRIGAHWTLPIALALAGLSFGGAGGVLLAVMLFASILAHELGHAVVARRRGVPIAGIDLHMFGGVAKMAAPPKSPDDEIAIAIAGPIVSLALAGALLGAHALVGGGVLLWLGSANLMLALFNLVPALPLDGGRVFRALLAKRQGLYRGTVTAVRVARVFAVLLAAGGVFSGQLMLVLLAVLIWMMGSAELRNVEQHEVLVRMGAWHPAEVPWVRYDVAADDERAPYVRGRTRARAVLEPDAVYD